MKHVIINLSAVATPLKNTLSVRWLLFTLKKYMLVLIWSYKKYLLVAIILCLAENICALFPFLLSPKNLFRDTDFVNKHPVCTHFSPVGQVFLICKTYRAILGGSRHNPDPLPHLVKTVDLFLGDPGFLKANNICVCFRLRVLAVTQGKKFTNGKFSNLPRTAKKFGGIVVVADDGNPFFGKTNVHLHVIRPCI
jgi:hypothetical protein